MTKIERYRSKKIMSKFYPDPTLGFKGKKFEVNNWIISEFVVENLIKVADIHPYPLQELVLLTSAVCFFKPDFVFEWGTNVGKSAFIFHKISQRFNLDIKIYTIDLPDMDFHRELPTEDQVGYLIRNISGVIQLRGDGLTESADIVSKLKQKTKCLFFLDGDHSYDSVYRELMGIDKFKTRNCMIIHDTFNQTAESGYNIGPFKAVNDFLSRSKKTYQMVKTDLGLPGMTVLL